MRGWQAHERAVQLLAFAPDGGTLATLGEGDPAARVWDLACGGRRWELTLLDEPAVSLAFAPDGRTVAVGRPWAIELWDPATGEQLTRLEAYRHVSASLAFAPDGATFLSVGLRRGGPGPDSLQGHVWDAAAGSIIAEFVEPLRDPFGLAHALDAHTLFWAANDAPFTEPDTACLIDVPTGRVRAVLATPGPVHAAAWAPDGRRLAAAVRGNVHLWAVGKLPATAEPRRLAPRAVLPGPAERIDGLAFSPDGRRLLTGSARSAVRLWDVPELKPPGKGRRSAPPTRLAPRASFDWGIGPVTALAFAPDGLTAAAGGRSGQVVVWDVDG